MTTYPRVNVGSGDFPLTGWVNLDQFGHVNPDIVCTVPPLPFADESVSEIYAGHCVEHMTHPRAEAFVTDCRRALIPGGKLGLVVPDMREVLRRYVNREDAPVQWPSGTWRDMRDLDEICRMFLYSTEQESPHLWSYDLHTLGRLLESCGMRVVGQIDRWDDPRVPVGAWFQTGLDAVKPDAS